MNKLHAWREKKHCLNTDAEERKEFFLFLSELSEFLFLDSSILSVGIKMASAGKRLLPLTHTALYINNTGAAMHMYIILLSKLLKAEECQVFYEM